MVGRSTYEIKQEYLLELIHTSRHVMRIMSENQDTEVMDINFILGKLDDEVKEMKEQMSPSVTWSDILSY